MHAEKIKPIEEIAEICAQLREKGRTVVQAHGVFDLLHIGHLQHLRSARKFGNQLVVTVTSDEFVNKGVGRPVFSDAQRADMLASLEIVDFVAINRAPDALGAIRAIKPSIYAKGPDYKDAKNDITAKIDSERCEVEAHGGRLMITEDIVYSSSALINRYMNIYDEELQEFLNEFRSKHTIDEFNKIFEKTSEMTALLVGDAIIDEYLYARPMGKSAKESIIAAQYENKQVFAGGVFAAARSLAQFVKHVDLITVLGDTESHRDLIDSVLPENVTLHAITRPNTPTTRKTRIVDPSYVRKLFEVYYFDDRPINGGTAIEFNNLIKDRAITSDITVVTDFGHGLMLPETIDMLCTEAQFLAVNAQTNAANRGFNPITRYGRADYICIDRDEALIAVADKHACLEEIAGTVLPSLIDCKRFTITKGREGCIVFDTNRNAPNEIPAMTKRVVDTVGAGDAFFVVTSAMLRAGATVEQAGFVGNAVGAMKSQLVGHSKSVEKIPVVKYLNSLLK